MRASLLGRVHAANNRSAQSVIAHLMPIFAGPLAVLGFNMPCHKTDGWRGARQRNKTIFVRAARQYTPTHEQLHKFQCQKQSSPTKGSRSPLAPVPKDTYLIFAFAAQPTHLVARARSGWPQDGPNKGPQQTRRWIAILLNCLIIARCI